MIAWRRYRSLPRRASCPGEPQPDRLPARNRSRSCDSVRRPTVRLRPHAPTTSLSLVACEFDCAKAPPDHPHNCHAPYDGGNMPVHPTTSTVRISSSLGSAGGSDAEDPRSGTPVACAGRHHGATARPARHRRTARHPLRRRPVEPGGCTRAMSDGRDVNRRVRRLVTRGAIAAMLAGPSEAPSEMAGPRLTSIAAPAVSDSCAGVGRPLGSRGGEGGRRA